MSASIAGVIIKRALAVANTGMYLQIKGLVHLNSATDFNLKGEFKMLDGEWLHELSKKDRIISDLEDKIEFKNAEFKRISDNIKSIYREGHKAGRKYIPIFGSNLDKSWNESIAKMLFEMTLEAQK